MIEKADAQPGEDRLRSCLCSFISRARVKWGIPVPQRPDHVLYVWVDALVNSAGVAGANAMLFFDPVLRGVFGGELAGASAILADDAGIGRTFQLTRIFASLTVLENMLVGEHTRLRAGALGAIFRPPSTCPVTSR